MPRFSRSIWGKWCVFCLTIALRKIIPYTMWIKGHCVAFSHALIKGIFHHHHLHKMGRIRTQWAFRHRVVNRVSSFGKGRFPIHSKVGYWKMGMVHRGRNFQPLYTPNHKNLSGDSNIRTVLCQYPKEEQTVRSFGDFIYPRTSILLGT